MSWLPSLSSLSYFVRIGFVGSYPRAFWILVYSFGTCFLLLQVCWACTLKICRILFDWILFFSNPFLFPNNLLLSISSAKCSSSGYGSWNFEYLRFFLSAGALPWIARSKGTAFEGFKIESILLNSPSHYGSPASFGWRYADFTCFYLKGWSCILVWIFWKWVLKIILGWAAASKNTAWLWRAPGVLLDYTLVEEYAVA